MLSAISRAARVRVAQTPFQATKAATFSTSKDTLCLPADSNQARGLAQYAIDMLDKAHADGSIDASVWKRVEQFHTDSVMCGLSAIALKTNAPCVLAQEAAEDYSVAKNGCSILGRSDRVIAEKAVVANAAAVREWDSNGTVFGYRGGHAKHQAGEFGHNDFYPVVLAAAETAGVPMDGARALKAMIVLDEIRGRLAEVFSLKSYKIDHVLHGSVASAAVYGALMGASVDQIESAIGMAVAHYVPMRAIRAGKQLSDSKGSSAALSTEAAVMAVKRSMRGFLGPRDIFRNPEAVYRFFEPTTGAQRASKDNVYITLGDKVRWGQGPAPFDLLLATGGDDFAVCGMHFKLGLYEHQSAGALEGVLKLVKENSELQKGLAEKGLVAISKITVVAYEPAFGIIGDPAKKDPTTRQSADHSMAFIASRLLLKAAQALQAGTLHVETMDGLWKQLMLSPFDYGAEALNDADTRALMQKIEFTHGGEEYDCNYPDGIPTSLKIHTDAGKIFDSEMVLYPSGHARNIAANLDDILAHKAELMGKISYESGGNDLIVKLRNMRQLPDVRHIYSAEGEALISTHAPIDG